MRYSRRRRRGRGSVRFSRRGRAGRRRMGYGRRRGLRQRIGYRM